MDKKKKPTATLNSLATAGNTKDKVSEPKDCATIAMPTNHTDIGRSRIHIVENFYLLWLDKSIDEIKNEDCRNTITKLRQVVNTVNTFTDVDECINFIRENEEEKTFVIFSGAFGQTTVPVVHDMAQVRAIYIFCGNKALHEQWTRQWPKVKGVFSDITPICESLKQAARDCDRNAVSLSFIAPSSENSNQDLNQLDQSFMYTQILKEVLHTIDFEQKHFVEFITYSREQFADDPPELNKINEFELKNSKHSPIWWYTYECFLYKMLNRALREMKVELVIKMGFFIKNLHQHITKLHSQQYDSQQHLTSFIVYRGQGLPSTAFDKLKKTPGGLLSFNNFLSTSDKREVSLDFARRSIDKIKNLVGILFVMTIDPYIRSTSFANIQKESYIKTEGEILFSMHSIFRTGHVKQIENNPDIWQVDLILTSDNDPQLHAVTECIRKELQASKGWDRLGQLLINLGHFDKAEELYQSLLYQTSVVRENATFYYHLGCIKFKQGKYLDAIAFYVTALQIYQEYLPPDHFDFGKCHNDIGLVYESMAEYSQAFLSHEKALEIYKKNLSENHSMMATSYNNIGGVYEKTGEYSKALSYYEKALETRQKTLPPNHPYLAICYSNIGSVYSKRGKYSKAHLYYEKVLKIQQKTLPPNHPDLATSLNNIGSVYENMARYPQALSSHEKALEIYQKAFSENHPLLAASYNNIGGVYFKLGNFSEALSYYKKDLEISEKTLPENHPDLATSYNNIGMVYNNMSECSTALRYYEKALEIRKKALHADHPDLSYSYNNMAFVYENMGDHSKALWFFERAADIGQRKLSENHLNLLTIRRSIERVKKKL